MTTDYIRKAVELADGWWWADYGDADIQLEMADGAWWHCDDEAVTPDDFPRILSDALAAQLVRQVDALDPWVQVNIHCRTTEVFPTESRISTTIRSEDRTMNTIRAIVDSGVLENNDD